MLTAAAMNGFVIWIYNVINWFRRTYYHFKGAVSVFGRLEGTGKQEGTWAFTFEHEGREQRVSVTEPGGSGLMDKVLTDSGEAELLWIPGASRAMLMRYFNTKTVLVCDILSIAALIQLIAGVALTGSPARNMAAVAVMVYLSIPCMIITAVIRKRFRKY